MKMNVKILVVALGAAGLVSSVQSALADTITGPTVVPAQAQPVAPGVYSVTYPVTVTLTGGAPQALNFISHSDGTWTAPAGWTYAGKLNNAANTAVFNTTSGATTYGIALSSTGTTQFVPGQTGAVVTPPSVGLTVLNRPVSGTAIAGWSGATATGKIEGFGATTATLVGAPASVQVIGVNPGGLPVGTAVVGKPISVNPTSATATPGYAHGQVAVNSKQPNQSIGWGQYTVTVPHTPTPAGTTTVGGSIDGTSGSVGASGIYLNSIGGTATYNVNTGTIVASPTETAVFGVDTDGNTAIGGTLSVTGQTSTHGITNTGNVATTTLGVSGNATVGGTLGVTGNTTIAGTLTANGIANTGNVATSTLGVTGNATIGGTLAVAGQSNTNGINNTGNIANSGNLANAGNATVGGTLGVAGGTTLGSTAGTGGNMVVVNSSGVTANAGSSTLVLTSNAAGLSGGGASMVLSGNRATFSGPAVSGSTGGPITVSGIANGGSQYDAVNFGQFDEARQDASRGIAATAAALNIPQLDQNKAFNLGIGVGGFDGEVGFAVGGSARVSRDGILRASVAGAGGGDLVWGVGGGWSW